MTPLAGFVAAGERLTASEDPAATQRAELQARMAFPALFARADDLAEAELRRGDETARASAPVVQDVSLPAAERHAA